MAVLGSVVVGCPKPGIDVHRASRLAQVIGQGKEELEAFLTHGTWVEPRHRGLGPVDQHQHPLVGHGVPLFQPQVGTGDVQPSIAYFSSHIVRDVARAVGHLQMLGTEFPRGGLLVPLQGTVVPVLLDERVAGRMLGLRIFFISCIPSATFPSPA